MVKLKQKEGEEMHRHYDDPRDLESLLPTFLGGEFILKEGRGKDTLVHHGKIDRVVVPNLSQQKISIKSSIVYVQSIGRTTTFPPAKRWERVNLFSRKLEFVYTWFYQQPRHARLKLEFIPKKDEADVERQEKTHNRCWLCSHTDPIYLDLFRTMLMKLFLEESLEKESALKKIRDRFLR